MKKKFNLILASVLILGGFASTTIFTLDNNIQTVVAAKTVKKLKPNSKYPNIKSKYDIKDMSQYTDDDLFDAVTLNKFYVKDWGYNSYMGDRHLLLTPTKKSKQYFLVVTKTKKVFKGDRITVQGSLNGPSHVNQAQIKVGMQKKYLNKPDTLVLADKVAIYKTK